ncbi:MAG: KpsF/GutQ family sugar-phosphate isomerase [Planctomycetota bacterium]
MMQREGTSARNSALSPFDVVRCARDIILNEADALRLVSENIPADFNAAVELIIGCRGAVIVTGMGKAGWIGRKVSASFSSTGTRSHVMHPAEAFHGDLGCIGTGDIVLAFSNSGETSEVIQILPSLQKMGTTVIAVTSNARSTLATSADLILDYPKSPEAGHLGLAPSTSTSVMLAIGDALALVASQQRAFRDIDFAKFHPGGSLGRQLSTVDEIMRPLTACRLATETETVRDIYVQNKSEGRRVGVILIVDDSGRLSGLFTDSDLARLLECQKESGFDGPIREVMTPGPITVVTGSKSTIAVETLACRNLSELPVVDSVGKPVGLIDITDVVGMIPSN